MSSASFFRLEKKRAADRWVAALRKPDGTLVSSPSDLCSSFVTFYSSLLTLGECHSTLLGMARRKAPGSDGLPNAKYE